ncbi:MAG: hypothetical protein ABSD56_14105 [Bryobacteraceae bacterium]
MLYFPQLSTGSTAQFPCLKRIRERTVATEAEDGSVVKLFDPGGSAVEWELELDGLSGEEWAALEGLFQNAEGRAGSFVFLDPLGNLLSWSEELAATAWEKAGTVGLTGGVSDPLGGSSATRATSSGAQGWIEQAIAAPGSYQYCLSVYARSDTAPTVTLYERAGAETANLRFALAPAWRRLEFPCKLAQAAETVTFGARLEAGATVDLFGFQVEAQTGASAYKRTGARSGVYANACFAVDVLEMRSEGPGAYSCAVRIRAR